MLELTAEQFGQRAYDLNLIDARQLQSVWSQFRTHDVSPEEFLKALVRREYLTNYQVERLQRGEKGGFFYGDYKVLYLVGKGTFARVYRAVHKETGEVVAVKVLRKHWSEKPLELERFLREGRLGSQLRHPNIVPIYDVQSVKREHFLVMAFVEGQSLREFVRLRRRLDPLEATVILSGIMSGLVYASEKGITHRDLKLSNVLISSDGRPQLVDFGLAVGADEGSPNARTVDYAGLEKLTGVDKDDPRSDIYFAGCMYYHMLAGKPPLAESRERFQQLNMSRFREVVPLRQLLPDVPTVVESVVNKAMALTVSERYSRPVDMLVDLNKAREAMEAAARQGDTSGSSLTLSSHQSRCVLVLESHEAIQSALRTAFKKDGYHVILMEDPDRAWQRILDAPTAIGCVIISTGRLGAPALSVYKQMRTYPVTKSIPTVLLLGKSHAPWQEKLGLPTEAHRCVVMPLRVSQLLQEVQQVFPVEQATEGVAGAASDLPH